MTNGLERLKSKNNLLADLDIVIKHPGHPDQKVHGRRHHAPEQQEKQKPVPMGEYVNPDEAYAAFERLTGLRTVQRKTLLAMTGAPDDAEPFIESLSYTDDWLEMSVKITHEHYAYPSERRFQIYRDVHTNKDIKIAYNDLLYLTDDAPQGMGTQIFARQVDQLSKLGFAQIETTAGGNGKGYEAVTGVRNHANMNGYYTWARFGYTGDIPNPVLGIISNLSEQRDTLQGELAKVPWDKAIKTFRISDLLALPGGASVWKQFGTEFHGVFELEAGSQSQKILKAYLAEKNKLKKKSLELTLKHPGHADQKVHGNWAHGSNNQLENVHDGTDVLKDTKQAAVDVLLKGLPVNNKHKPSDSPFSKEVVMFVNNMIDAENPVNIGSANAEFINKMLDAFKDDKDFEDFAASELGIKNFASDAEKIRAKHTILLTIQTDWANSSSSSTSLGLQKAAASVLGLDTSRLQQRAERLSSQAGSYELKKEWLKRYQTWGDAPFVKKLAKHMYDETQRELQEAGIDNLVLFRSGNLKLKDNRHDSAQQAVFTGSPLSSFSAYYKIASEFAGTDMVAISVPREHIFSFARTGVGTLRELEFVVTNHPKTGWTWKRDNYATDSIKSHEDLIAHLRTHKKKSLEQELLLKHPGHDNQNVHGNWAHDGDLNNRESKEGPAAPKGWHPEYAPRMTDYGTSKDAETIDTMLVRNRDGKPLVDYIAEVNNNNPTVDQYSYGGKIMFYQAENALKYGKKLSQEFPEPVYDEALKELTSAFGGAYGSSVYMGHFEKTGRFGSAVALVQLGWAANSRTGTWVMAFKNAITQEFNLDNSWLAHLNKQGQGSDWDAQESRTGHDNATLKYIPEKYREPAMKVLKRLARLMYEDTQELLKKNGIEDLQLYRGKVVTEENPNGYTSQTRDSLKKIKTTPSDVNIRQAQPVSSWTARFSAAKNFTAAYQDTELRKTPVMLTARVPRERIFSLAVTGLGTDYEAELLVLGGNYLGHAWKGRKTSQENTSSYLEYQDEASVMQAWKEEQEKKKLKKPKKASVQTDSIFISMYYSRNPGLLKSLLG